MLRKSWLILGMLSLAGLVNPRTSLAISAGPTPPPPGTTDSQPVSDVTNGTFSYFVFSEPAPVFPASPRGLFYNDMDDVYSGTGVNGITYTLTGTLKGAGGLSGVGFSSDSFSPSSNFSGGFLGFLGVDVNGASFDISTGPTKVANIYSSDVSHTLLGSVYADYSVTNGETTTFTIVNTSSYVFDPPNFGAIIPLNDTLPITIYPAEVVPEPASVALAAAGGLVLAGYSRIRRGRAGRREA